MEQKIKIVVDSSADIFSGDPLSEKVGIAPLKIITNEKEYVDNDNLDVDAMLNDLEAYSGKSHTSCPSPSDWIDAFNGEKNIVCITITSGLSGSYNSAIIAKKEYEELDSNNKVFVLDSLSTGAEIRLIIERINELVSKGVLYEDVCKKISKYCKHNTNLLFMLSSMRNLANNGRVSPLIAKITGILGIRVVGKASDVGTLETLDKARGEKKALSSIISRMKQLLYKGGKVRIGHCDSLGIANTLKQIIHGEFNKADVQIYKCRGLCSFYMERGGLLIGFES